MKLFLTICLLIIGTLSFSQTETERSLNSAEEQLIKMQNQKIELYWSLTNQGISANTHPQYIQLDQLLKDQLEKTKKLRKMFKNERKASRKAQAGQVKQGQSSTPNYPASNQNSVAVASQKDKIKALKKEIKTIKKEQKAVITQLESIGQNPVTNPAVQDFDRRILAKQEELTALQATPSRVNVAPKVIQPQISQTTPQANQPQVAIDTQKQAINAQKQKVKALKKEIKAIQKEQKAVVNQIIAVGQNPVANPAVQDFDRRILAKQQELATLQSTPLPVAPQVNQPQVNSPVVTRDTINNQPLPTSTDVEPVVEIIPIGLSTILFEKFSTEIANQYELHLNHVAKQMIDEPALRLQIQSFTDNSEKNKVSMQITAGMANAVAQAMVNRGISPDRLDVKANGSKKAVGDNNNFFGQARNRRVELSFF